MTDIVNGKGPHDVLVGIVSKAINTGMRLPRKPSNQEYFRGRVNAFVYSAALLAHQMYNCDFDKVRHVLLREVKELRANWSPEDMRDAGAVGNAATMIVIRVLADS